MLLPKPFLNRMELPILFQPFDGADLTPVRLDRKESAGLDRLSVQMDRASSAVGGIAANMGPGQAKTLRMQWTSRSRGSTSASISAPLTLIRIFCFPMATSLLDSAQEHG